MNNDVFWAAFQDEMDKIASVKGTVRGVGLTAAALASMFGGSGGGGKGAVIAPKSSPSTIGRGMERKPGEHDTNKTTGDKSRTFDTDKPWSWEKKHTKGHGSQREMLADKVRGMSVREGTDHLTGPGGMGFSTDAHQPKSLSAYQHGEYVRDAVARGWRGKAPPEKHTTKPSFGKQYKTQPSDRWHTNIREPVPTKDTQPGAIAAIKAKGFRMAKKFGK